MWEERFRRLNEWKLVHGHCAVPIAQGELGTWVSKQRQLRKRGKLSQEKIDALNSLGFTWSTAEADWEDKFKRLCQWAKDRGHASVPFNEGELGWWVNTQRQCKRKGKLSLAREERLCSLGFVWNPSNSRNKASSESRAQLRIQAPPPPPLQQQQLAPPTSLLAPSAPLSGSSADTTPRTTPEKYDVLPGAEPVDPLSLLAADAKLAPHAYAMQPLPPPHMSHDELGAPSYPFAAEAAAAAAAAGVPGSVSTETGIPLTETPPQPHAEGPFSPVPVPLSNGLWSPIELTSPILHSSFLNGQLSIYGSSGFPLQLQPSVQQAVIPFSQAASLQTHSDDLEQLLSRSEPGPDADPYG